MRKMVLLIFCSFLLWATALRLLYPFSQDLVVDAGQWAGVVLIFALWFLGLLGCGRLLLRAFRINPVFGLESAAGAACLSVTAGLLGLFGWLQSALTLPLAIMLLAAAQIYYLATKPLCVQRLYFGLSSALPAVALGAMLFLLALRPDMFPDALWYNLTAARQWYSAGQISFTPGSIASVQSAFWEYLYLWPNIFFGQGLAAALAVHVFAQLTVFFAAFSGSIAVLDMLTAEDAAKFVKNRVWFSCALLAAMTTRELLYAATTAKNDWGACLWFLAGAALLLNERRLPDWGKSGLGFFFLGLAIAAKLSYFYPAAAFLILILISGRSFVRLSAMPALLLPLFYLGARNYCWTGNPFFPALGSVFESDFLPVTWKYAVASFQGLSPDEIGRSLLTKLEGFFPLTNILSILFLVPFFCPTFFPPRFRILQRTALLAMALYLLLTGSRAEARLIGAAPLIISMQSILVLGWLQERFFRSRCAANTLVAFAILLLIGAADIPWPRLQKILSGSAAQTFVLNAPGGKSLSFLLKEKKALRRVFLLHDTKLYYFLPFGGKRVWDDPKLEAELLKAKDAQAAVELLLNWIDTAADNQPDAIPNYLLVTKTAIDNYFEEGIVRRLIELELKHPEAVLAGDEEEKLIDLRLLRGS